MILRRCCWFDSGGCRDEKRTDGGAGGCSPPKGLGARLDALMEAHFPGSTNVERKFPVELIEISPDRPVDVGSTGVCVSGFVVSHPSGTPSLSLRIECDGKILAYTGDTEWVDALLEAGRNADLLIAEAYCFERKVRLAFRNLVAYPGAPDPGANMS